MVIVSRLISSSARSLAVSIGYGCHRATGARESDGDGDAAARLVPGAEVAEVDLADGDSITEFAGRFDREEREVSSKVPLVRASGNNVHLGTGPINPGITVDANGNLVRREDPVTHCLPGGPLEDFTGGAAHETGDAQAPASASLMSGPTICMPGSSWL